MVSLHMISNKAAQKIHIYITTFDKQETSPESRIPDKVTKKMEEQPRRTGRSQKYICSMCLNSSPFENGLLKPCPACRKFCETCLNLVCTQNKKEVAPEILHKNRVVCTTEAVAQNIQTCLNDVNPQRNGVKNNDLNTKLVQTSLTDVNQGLNLLNEVLTVFQNKKNSETRSAISYDNKESHIKNAAVDNVGMKSNLNSKLTISNVLKHSIGEIECHNVCSQGKFTILNSIAPEYNRISEYSINLKHKSSSIPQMKLEELKNSLKEKTKSKDAIEEVNRMFATVKKRSHDHVDDSNRPLIRHGPRVLPVVKTRYYVDKQRASDDGSQSQTKDKSVDKICKCVQTSKNFHMSSGDTLKNIIYHNDTKDKSGQTNKNYCESTKEVHVCECCHCTFEN